MGLIENPREPILGAGLVGIGRTWGKGQNREVPSEREAAHYLQAAFDSGVIFFDTAPSYGESEKRLGSFLWLLSKEELGRVVVSTKFGEHWSYATETSYINHTEEMLRRSLDQSLKRLHGKIDVLFLHKTTPEVLRSDAMQGAIEFAKDQGIKVFGASVSDRVSADIVLSDPTYFMIQFPYNLRNSELGQAIISDPRSRNKVLVTNRPFDSGGLVGETDPAAKRQNMTAAYEFVTKGLKTGDVVLTGTKKIDNLRENLEIFKTALANNRI